MPQSPIEEIVSPNLIELTISYLEYQRKEVKNKKADLKMRDLPALKIWAHQLKGTGASYGLKKGGKLAETLEELLQAATPEWGAIDSICLTLFSYFETVELKLNEEET